MPYIAPKYKELLERNIKFLAAGIKKTAKDQIGESIAKRTAPYRYVCGIVGLLALPKERYTLLSGIRASFGDARDEWCRRKNVNPLKVEFTSPYFPILNKRINRLAQKIRETVIASKDDLLFQGILTYCWVALGNLIDDNNELMDKYIAGTLDHLYQDKKFYPAIMVPHEEKQIIKNGDVFSE